LNGKYFELQHGKIKSKALVEALLKAKRRDLPMDIIMLEEE